MDVIRSLEQKFSHHVRDLLIIFRGLALIMALFLIFFSPEHTVNRSLELWAAAFATLYTAVYIFFFRRMTLPLKSTVLHFIWGGLDLVVAGFLLYAGCVELPEFFVYVLAPIFTACYFFDQKMGFVAAGTTALFYHLILWAHLGSPLAIFKSAYVGIYLANVVGYFLAVVVFSYWVNLLRQLQQEMDTVERMNVELRELQGRLQEMAALKERNRLSREVHDRVASKLYGVGLRLEMLASRFGPQEKAMLLTIKEQVALSQIELKDCLRAMQAPEGSPQDFRETARDLAFCFRNQFNLNVSLNMEEQPVMLAPRKARELTYVLSEALTNIRKHADAHQVKVDIFKRGTWVMLSIEDDGRGFDPGEGNRTGFGLTAMRSRAEELAGHYNIESLPGKGTKVSIEIPAS